MLTQTVTTPAIVTVREKAQKPWCVLQHSQQQQQQQQVLPSQHQSQQAVVLAPSQHQRHQQQQQQGIELLRCRRGCVQPV
jgi:hypothetical protein